MSRYEMNIQETLVEPLGTLVANEVLREQGVVTEAAPIEVAEAALCLTWQINELPVSKDCKDQVLEVAAEQVEAQGGLTDASAVKRRIIMKRRTLKILSPSHVSGPGRRIL